MFARVALAAAIGAVSLILSTSAAAFQAPATAQEQPRTSTAGDKNDRYCETITQTGSRLAKKKWCGTRAEWEDKRLQDRKVVEQFQTLQCMPSHNSAKGQPTC